MFTRRAVLKQATIGLSVIGISALLGATPVLAKKPEVFVKKKWAYAAGGFDVVAYHSLAEDAAPIAGLDEFTAEYLGVSWRFSSAENMAAFAADPDRYRPQYGGYCAYATAKGYTAKGEPKHWTVYQGKLYLNFNGWVKRRWLKNIDAYIAQGNDNWPATLDD